VDAAIIITGKTFRFRAGVADRPRMMYVVMIGRDIPGSGDFLVDPSRRRRGVARDSGIQASYQGLCFVTRSVHR
jgi:hypothetical protein